MQQPNHGQRFSYRCAPNALHTQFYQEQRAMATFMKLHCALISTLSRLSALVCLGFGDALPSVIAITGLKNGY